MGCAFFLCAHYVDRMKLAEVPPFIRGVKSDFLK